MQQLDDFMEDIRKSDKHADVFVSELPEEPERGLAEISMVIDKYALKLGRSSWSVWEMMYEVAKKVHDKMGDYAL